MLKMQFEVGDLAARIDPFFTPLSLPSLEFLELGFAPSSQLVWPTHEFSAFQMRAPNITHISLKDCPIPSQALATLLRLTPVLTTLTLLRCGACIDNEFLQTFSYDHSRAARRLVPQLREIDWCGIGSGRLFDDDTLEAAIRSRCWMDDTPPANVARLQKVTVMTRIPKLRRVAFGDKMKDLVEHGLELRLL
jgi:hypothetical protein